MAGVVLRETRQALPTLTIVTGRPVGPARPEDEKAMENNGFPETNDRVGI
jgi:hypothetical protein